MYIDDFFQLILEFDPVCSNVRILLSLEDSSFGPTENLKKMSWDNPVSPIDAKNSIGFFVAFFWGLPGLLGYSVSFQFYILGLQMSRTCA